ncbi:MAG: GTP cyclohydrolase [Polyangiaceae bacterium]|nr:GTP cyclohydrolase [Polyangiaceae bacterium]
MARDADARERAARAIEAFLDALGYTIEGELVGTGRRVADTWIDELVAGERTDPAALLRGGALDLGEGAHGVVVLRDVSIATMCPHHLLPSHGKVTLGYLPNRLAAGLGSLAQAAEACARRLVLQETLGETIARAVMKGLDARGAFCRLQLVHTCFATRGERQSSSVVDTLALEGVFEQEMRDVAMLMCSGAPSSSEPRTP